MTPVGAATFDTGLAAGGARGPAVLVRGAGGTVAVTRDPFRLVVRDTAGRVVLAEVPNPAAPPTPYLSVGPVPMTSTSAPSAPLYAPLTVTVGRAMTATYPGTPWVGNLLVGAATGMRYSARTVLAARSVAGGVRLTVSTSDPAGTRLAVTVRAVGRHFVVDAGLAGGALPAGTAAMVGDAFASAPAEQFHGFGGRHDGIDHRGQSFDTWVQEENLGVGPLQPVPDAVATSGGRSYMFPNGPAGAYYVQPQFLSSHGYGFLLDQPELAQWRMASDRPDAWSLQAAAAHLRYVVAPGPGPAAVRELTQLTGRQPVPPAWALGPQLDRLVSPGQSAAAYYQQVLADLARIRRTRLPLTGYRIEGWAQLTPGQLHHVIAVLHSLGIHALLYYRSFIADDIAGTEPQGVFTDALTHGYFARTAAGTPYLTDSVFVVGVAGVVDFTNPAAARWFSHRLDAGLDTGADGFMADFGEQVAPDMHFADGETGATMHNRYPVLYQQVVRRAVQTYQARHPGRHIYWYSRAGYSGSARYEAANFPGDETTDWTPSTGLASQTPDMLNRAVGGAYGYTTDIGGYLDYVSGTTSKELFLRWAEWAALSPLFRDHGSPGSGVHTPWSYDSATLRSYTALSRLHAAAAPLIRRLWVRADRTGLPVTRPLWLAYPNDPTAARQDQEWLLGPDVLVAPVVTEAATSRNVYLPDGCWRYEPTGQRYVGRRGVTVAAPLSTLPYFFRCGTRSFTPPGR